VVKAVWRVVLLSVVAAGCASGDSAEAIRRGDALVEKKQYAQAASAYRTAVSRSPRDGRARMKLANALMLAGNWTPAVAEAVRATDLLPDDVEANLLAATLMLPQKRFVDVADRMSTILQRDPNNVQALILWGNAVAHLNDSNWALYVLGDAMREGTPFEGARRGIRMARAAAADAAAEEAFRKARRIAPTVLETSLALANFLWAAGRPDQAEEPLKAVADQAPGHTVANYALGAFYLARHRGAEAEKYLKNAAGSREFGWRARFALADYYVDAHRDADALSLLATMSADDGNGDVTLRLAAVEHRTGKRSDATRRIDALLKRNPANMRAVLLKAQFLSAAHQWGEALRFARIAVAQSGSSEARATLGRALFGSGDSEGAFKELVEAFRLNPESTELPIELTRLSLALGRNQQGLQYARDAVRKNPGHREAAVSLVKTLLALADYSAAENALEPLLARDSASPDVQTQRGVLEMARGRDDIARASFVRALAADGELFDALAGLVALDLKRHALADARARVDAAVAAHPRDPDYLLLAGRVHAAEHDAPRAEAMFRKALELDPLYETAALALGDFLAAGRRCEDAKQVLEQLIIRRPDSIDAYTSLGLLLEKMGRPREARTEYEKLLARKPHAPKASSRLAALYVDQGENLDLALTLAVDAKQQRPDDPAVNDVLGWVYLQKNQVSRALIHLKDAARAAPDDAVYRFHLGSAYMRAGDTAKAREELRRALEIDPQFAGAAQARAALASRRQ
jgi:cellulose synthase operon protein C